MKHLIFKFPNLNLCSFANSHSPNRRRRKNVADILLYDEDQGGADFMDGVRETPPSRRGSPSSKCYSPRRLVAWLLTLLRPNKERSISRRRLNEEEEAPTLPMNEINGNEELRQLHGNDTSFKLGVGCGFLYLIAASKNELDKMAELRKEMEMLLQNVKGELQTKDALLKPLKQSDDLACSITDIQEASSSSNYLSVHSQTSYAHPIPKSNMVHNCFLEYKISEQDICAEEINELQAEFEIELQRLQLYLDGEAAFADEQQERVKFYTRTAENENWQVTLKDSRSTSHRSSFGEIMMEHQAVSSDVSFGVPPVELERRLHELLETRLQERITELESALECTTQKLIEKEIEVTRWKDTARLISHHGPETSRFTFPIDPETALKLSQVVG